MSRQARRARGRELARRRRQAARLIALATIPDVEGLHCSNCAGTGEEEDGGVTWTCEYCAGSGAGLDVAVGDILGGERFDVHAARAYGEQLVREGADALATWAVYLDWLELGGWDASHGASRVLREAWAAAFGKRPRMDGAAMVRMGRRLLAALEGQPSECQACAPGERRVRETCAEHDMDPEPMLAILRRGCDCRGTGHNLAGVLPPVEPSPQQRRKDARRDPVKDADGREDTFERRTVRFALRLGVAGSLDEYDALRRTSLKWVPREAPP